MSVGARHELARSVSVRYLKADKVLKGQILDEFCSACGYSRKHGLRVLRHPPKKEDKRRVRRRPRVYEDPEAFALSRLWPVSGYLGSRRLTAALPALMEALEHHREWIPEPAVRSKLVRMSPSTCARLLSAIRAKHKPRGISTTKPGTLLKKQIAIRTGSEWEDDRPGYFETDLVAHCGETTQGSYLSTLTLTDICTGWMETAALETKTQVEVVANLGLSLRRVPFEPLGLDSDNGSEFINYHLKAFCDEKKLVFTRCRPYRKNDQAHIEQKNYAVVRKHVGYQRLEGCEHLKTLRELLGILRSLVNYFEPSMKLVAKERDGGHVKKRYDVPTTPYQRVIDSPHVSQENKDKLAAAYLELNPAALRRRLALVKRELWGEQLKTLAEYNEDGD